MNFFLFGRAISKFSTSSPRPCSFPGYCVEGTLAKHILSEPEEISTMSGQKLPLKMRVNYISFSAHADYKQISQFVRALKPPEIVSIFASSFLLHSVVHCSPGSL
jgi:Cft2 family RNA processing exonuclease